MNTLVKYKRGHQDATLLSGHGQFEMQDCGLVIRFGSGDNRKPDYAVLMDTQAIRVLVDDLLEHLKRK